MSEAVRWLERGYDDYLSTLSNLDYFVLGVIKRPMFELIDQLYDARYDREEGPETPSDSGR